MAGCLIIDDEPLSREVLRRYIAEVLDLELLGECRNAHEATGLLNRQKADLIFLDIRMPGLSGISFARSLSAAPLIIFTTAYPEYAVEGFELDATDYLVKPFSFERFLKAVNKALTLLQSGQQVSDGERKLLVRSDKKLYALPFSDILFVEGQGDYIRIHTPDKRLMVHDTLRNFLESLPMERFMRIQKSYVVNLEKIEYLEGRQLCIGGEHLPVSQARWDELIERFSAGKH